MLVQASWLKQHLRQVTVLDVTTVGFGKMRIAGARRLFPSAIFADNDASTLAALQAAGVGRQGRIVLYQNSMRPVPVARVFAALDSLGLGDRVSALQGGLNAWLDAHGPLDYGPPPAVPPGSAAAGPDATARLFVDRDYVASHVGRPHVVVIDARARVLFSGQVIEHPGEEPGHIPGAVNLPYTELALPNGRFRSPPELAAAFRRVGVRPGDDIIVYCHSGLKAGVDYFAARLLGYNVRLYAGSWLDWTHPSHSN